MVEDELKNDYSCIFFNIGSCGIYIVYGVFKDGCEVVGWIVQKIFGSFYWLFKDSLVRRDDYSKVIGSSVFFLKFC